jgi:hypothetical protein
MAANNDEAMRWLAGALAWDRKLAELRQLEAEVDLRVEAPLEVQPEPRRQPRPEPLPEPVGMREPERVPFGAPLVRVPRRDHRVA